MGATSSEVKNRWNKKNYERIGLMLPNGCRGEIHAAAARHGVSMADLLCLGVLQVCADDGIDMPALRQKVAKNSQKQPTPPPHGA